MRIFFEFFSLPEKQKLSQPNLLNLVRKLLPRRASDDGRRSTMSVGHWRVMRTLVSGLERSEQCIVLKPVRLLVAK